MKETIINFKKGPFPKKYTAYVKDKKTKNTFKPWFHDKNDDPNNNSEAKKAIIKIIKIIGFYALLALIISYFI